MNHKEFTQLVSEIGFSPVPEKFRKLVHNVALLVQKDVSKTIRKDMHIPRTEALLGLYVGVPHTQRNEGYGYFGTMPDTITLFQKPIEDTARETGKTVRRIIGETIWHEVAHHFGLDETQVRAAEKKRQKNTR